MSIIVPSDHNNTRITGACWVNSNMSGRNPLFIIIVYSVCVCVFFPFILDIKFVGRTSRGHTRGRSHRISHPPSYCGACLNFSREKDSAIPFPNSINRQARVSHKQHRRHEELGLQLSLLHYMFDAIYYHIP